VRIEPPLREAMARHEEISCRIPWPDPTAAAGTTARAERWFRLRGAAHAGGMILSFREVTRELQGETGRAQAAKMEAVGLLTGGIAHDFNNLLTVIIGNLEAIELLGRPVDAADPAVADSLSAARNAAELVHQLLAFARRQPLAPAPLEVESLLREMMGLLRSSTGPAISIGVETHGDCRSALVDRTQLQNALINLALNAADAMPGGGELRIHVSCAVLPADEPRLAEQELPPGEYLRIVVSDTGHGIAPEDLERVFEPFFTTKPPGAGTGLGLSMVYGFVRQSRGGVAISSTPGQGTAISLFLPVAEPRQPVAEPVAAELPPGRGERVLLVEDVAPVRRQTERALQHLGYRVTAVADAAGALAAIERDGAPDLLLTDLKLSGAMDGRRLAECVRAEAPGTALLFVTGFAGEIALGGLIEPGRNLLLKPFSLPNLAGHLRDALAEVPADGSRSATGILEKQA
ncbi:MAG: response regulator, partial [Gluconacetobacter diazotrophicus]|nr:response regulator [Gluconacetobacter diazotrophicus]